MSKNPVAMDIDFPLGAAKKKLFNKQNESINPIEGIHFLAKRERPLQEIFHRPRKRKKNTKAVLVMKEAEIYLEEIEQIPSMSAQEFHTRLLRAAAGDEAAQLELVNANLRLVVECARKYVGQGAPFSDLIQEGNIGLMKAVKKFSTKGTATFVEYAHECIEKAIIRGLRELRADDNLTTLDTHKQIEQRTLNEDDYVEGLTLADLLADEATPDSSARLSRLELMENLSEALDTLPPQEKKILSLRFGLGNKRAYSSEEVARIFKMSPDNLRSVEAKALKKLSSSKRLREFL